MKKTIPILLISFILVSCNGRFEFSPFTVISVENEQQREVADWFAWLFAAPGGFVPMVLSDVSDADVVLRHDPSLDEDHYRLDIDRNNIYIAASGTSGFFHAFMNLRRLLPDEIDMKRHADSVEWIIPVIGSVEGAGIYVAEDDYMGRSIAGLME